MTSQTQKNEAIKLSSLMKRVLHIARNSNVEVVVVNDMGSIPVGVPRSFHVDYFIFITLSPSLKFTIIYFIIIKT